MGYEHWTFEGAQHVACMVIKEIMGDGSDGITKEEWVCSKVAMAMVNDTSLHRRYFNMLDRDHDKMISESDLIENGFQQSDLPGIFAQMNESVNPYLGISLHYFKQALECRAAYVMRKYKKEEDGKADEDEDVDLKYWKTFRNEEEQWRKKLRL